MVGQSRLEALEQLYLEELDAESDVQAHLPLLRLLASTCHHVTEFGVRSGRSTVALLAGQPAVSVHYEINPHWVKHVTDRLVTAQVCVPGERPAKVGRTEVMFKVGSTLTAPKINVTDLLFVDTLHTGAQLRAELARHADSVLGLIVLHDTWTFGRWGEDGRPDGLTAAVREFLRNNREDWRFAAGTSDCNGLTILSRVGGAWPVRHVWKLMQEVMQEA